MLVCFSFQAKPGREGELERLLNNPEAGAAVARALGATRNTLFLGNGRVVRVLDFPDGSTPRALADVAKEDANVAAFLRALAPLIQNGFDMDVPSSLDVFNQRARIPLAYDVRA